MPTWIHIPCGTAHDHRPMRPDHCEFCVLVVPFDSDMASPKHEWQFIKPSKKEKRKIHRRKIGPKKRKRIFERDGWKCLRCGEKDKDLLTLDHVVPVSRGGDDSDGNLQTMCKRCNEMKGNKTGSNGMRWPPDREMRRAGLARGLVR